MKKTFLRDLVVGTISAQPFRVKNWLLRRHPRFLLGLLFRLEPGDVVISPAGPSSFRFLMKMQWQAHTEYVLGIYEPEFFQVLRRHLRPGDTCVDVGGHLGYYSMLMARLVGPGGRVITFEPVQENIAVLEENLAMNHMDNVRLVNTALGRCSGTMTLVRSESETMSATPSIRAYAVEGSQKQVEVNVDTLDAFLDRNGCRPKLIKIDVEGAEIEVLLGAMKTLANSHPVVMVEIHGWGEASNREVLDLFSSLHYSVSVVGTRGHEAFCVAIPNGNGA
ncbi:MAG TPA: FkbM family methyltransferase [Candidatus Acidoferrum sp.]|nr:FkbM family methyltransferase [Candidatus Acidoferrum sp.]